MTKQTNTSASTSTDNLINALVASGYAIIDDAMSVELITKLREQALSLQQAGVMRRATTGKSSARIAADNADNQASSQLRGDFTYWLEDDAFLRDADQAFGESSAYKSVTTAYLQQMEALRLLLNQSLFLGLFDFETHFAIYPAGAGYSKHLDQFQHSNAHSGNLAQQNTQRKISVILYLNKEWRSADGGQLRLYLNEAAPIDIEPVDGRMVVFLSDQFWHEVLPANRNRISLTGWFRTR